MTDKRRPEKHPDDGGNPPGGTGGSAPKDSKTTKRLMIALGIALALVILYNLSAGNL